MIKFTKILHHINRFQKLRFYFCSTADYFTQSKQFWREPNQNPRLQSRSPDKVQDLLINYLSEHCPKNQPLKTLDFIDKFCQSTWMNNYGPEKRKILDKVIDENKITKILAMGTYCGYSTICLHQAKPNVDRKIVSIEQNKKAFEIGKKILAHSGIKNIISKNQKIQEIIGDLNQLGPFDLLFMDQNSQDYLKDLKFLQERNLLKAGAIIITDNIICPGSPQYLQFMKQSGKKQRYRSILYHTYFGYTDIPDGVLVSKKNY